MDLNDYAHQSHEDNLQWWMNSEGRFIQRNKGELIALMHSELSEALEAIRKDLMDDKIPNRLGEEIELVDLLIRVFDYAGAFGLDLEGAYREKREFNAKREDHKIENRMQQHGKKF